jgi:RHS repeat-associated protein
MKNDAFGNRTSYTRIAGTSTTTVSYAVNSLNQPVRRSLGEGGYTNANVTLRYDANGNLTNDSVWAYSYDYENRLSSASSGTTNITYTYDTLGRLIRRTGNGVTNRFYYAGWQLIEERGTGPGLPAKYVVGPGLDEPIRMTRGGTNYYYHTDGLGSVTEVTTNGGFVVEQYTYDVYGAPTIKNGSGTVITNSAIGNRLMFTARDRDPDAGLYNYRFRYYNPALGRFVQPDPLGIFAGNNLYSYAENNPTGDRDPLGLANRKFEYKGTKVEIDDSKISKDCVAKEIKQVQSATDALQQISELDGTFKSHNLESLANPGTGANKNYGDPCQQYLRSQFEHYFPGKGFGAEEGAARGIFSLAGNKDVLQQDVPSEGMARMAAVSKQRVEVYQGFLKAAQSTVYPSK